MDYIIQRAQITVKPIYKCVVCGEEDWGRSETLEMQSSITKEELQVCVDNISNSHMPAGWAGYGKSIHKCPKHVT